MKEIIPSKVKLARKASRLSMDDLIARMGDKAISKVSVSKIERGLLRPSLSSLQAIADACQVPLSFFYDEGLSIGELDFRFDKDMPVKKAEQIKAMVFSEIQKYFSLESNWPVKSEKLNLLQRRVIQSYADAEDAACRLRKKWELGQQPIFSVYELLESHGIRVMELSIDESSVLGLSTFVNRSVPVVIINVITNQTTERKRFTALHELAHLMLNLRPQPESTPVYDTLSYKVTIPPATTERLCHYFAIAMLLPKPCLQMRLGEVRFRLTLPELISIRSMYGASIAAIIHRAHDLAMIDDEEYNNLYDNLINLNVMEEGWGTFPIMEKADRFPLLEERIKAEIPLLNKHEESKF